MAMNELKQQIENYLEEKVSIGLIRFWSIENHKMKFEFDPVEYYLNVPSTIWEKVIVVALQQLIQDHSKGWYLLEWRRSSSGTGMIIFSWRRKW